MGQTNKPERNASSEFYQDNARKREPHSPRNELAGFNLTEKRTPYYHHSPSIIMQSELATVHDDNFDSLLSDSGIVFTPDVPDVPLCSANLGGDGESDIALNATPDVPEMPWNNSDDRFERHHKVSMDEISNVTSVDLDTLGTNMSNKQDFWHNDDPRGLKFESGAVDMFFNEDEDNLSESDDSCGGDTMDGDVTSEGVYETEEGDEETIGRLPWMPPRTGEADEDDSEETSTYVRRRNEVRTFRMQSGISGICDNTAMKIIRNINSDLREDNNTLDRYESMLNKHPTAYQLHTQLGSILLDRYQQREAFLSGFPSVHATTDSELLCTLKRHKGSQAVILKHFQLALEGNPDDGIAHAQIARILTEQFKLYDTARRHYLKALEINTGDPEIHIRYADLISNQFRNFSDAVKHYREAIDLNNKDSNTHMKLGDILCKRAETREEAILHYTDAINLRGLSATASAHVYRQLARMYVNDGYALNALRHYADALRANPTDTTTHLEMVSLLEADGRFEQAEHHLISILRKDGKNVDLMIKLASILHQDGKIDAAMRWLLRAHELEPEDLRSFSVKTKIFNDLKGYMQEVSRDVRADLVDVHTKLKGDAALNEVQQKELLVKKTRLVRVKQSLNNLNMCLDKAFLTLVLNYSNCDDKEKQREQILARIEFLELVEERTSSRTDSSTKSAGGSVTHLSL